MGWFDWGIRRAWSVVLLVGMVLVLAPWSTSPAHAATGAVLLRQTSTYYGTLGDAVAAAESDGLRAYTLEVVGDAAEPGAISVAASDVTIVGSGGAHTVTGFSATVTGGSLTLGDGTASDLLTLSGSVQVTGGSIHVNDGIAVVNPAPAKPSDCYLALYPALRLQGSGVTGEITGGRLEGCTALLVEGGARLTEISGGELYGAATPAEVHGATVDLISGGVFRKTSSTIERYAFHLDSHARVGKITGGVFDSSVSPVSGAFMIIRGSWVDEISGGTFVSATALDEAALMVYADGVSPTGIGTVSGGLFSGAAPSAGSGVGLGMWLYGKGSRVDAITGGTFEAERALEPDAGSTIGSISGGKLVGATQGTRPGYGILNVGTIAEIGGDAEIVGRNAGIWNYAGARIDEISGGTVSSSGAYASGNGISNSGTVELISGGTIVGDARAVVSTYGRLNVVSGGAFWGKSSETFYLGYTVQLEPGLTGSRGVGRYQSGNARIFNDESLVVYPPDYEMSTETDTLPVAGVTAVEFRYLRLPASAELVVTVEGSCAAVDGAGSYRQGTTVALDAGECDGLVFAGWIVEPLPDGGLFDVDPTSVVTTFSMPGHDVAATAVWAHREGPGGCEETPEGCGETPGGHGETPDGCEEAPGGCGEAPGGEETPGGCEEMPVGCGEAPGGEGTPGSWEEAPSGGEETPGGWEETPGGKAPDGEASGRKASGGKTPSGLWTLPRTGVHGLPALLVLSLVLLGLGATLVRRSRSAR